VRSKFSQLYAGAEDTLGTAVLLDVIALVTSGLGLSLFVFRMACLELGHHMYRCASAHVLLPMREHTRTWPLSLLLV
jgi:hypothetical protein